MSKEDSVSEGFVVVNGERIEVKNGSLALYHKGIKDISMIEGLEITTNLKFLEIITDEISEIKGIENLNSLNHLNLRDN